MAGKCVCVGVVVMGACGWHEVEAVWTTRGRSGRCGNREGRGGDGEELNEVE